MVPQQQGPSGPMARGLLMTIEIRDADLILSQTQKMNMHEVPFCVDFLVNNIAREYLPGSTDSGLRLTRQLPTNLPEYTAKLAPCQPDSYSKQEPNVRTLWPCRRIMVSLTQLIAHFAIPVPISLSASPNRLKIEKLEDDLRLFGKFCPTSYLNSSQKEMIQVP